MKKTLMAAVAACALATGFASCATAPTALAAEPAAAAVTAPTADEARAFVADAERRLAELGEYTARVSWVRNTYITFDTMWLESRANTQATELGVQLAKGAARFNSVQGLDADTRRKLDLLKIGLVLPAPDRPGAAQELAEIGTRMDSAYATGKFTYNGEEYNIDRASQVIARSRNPAETEAMYEGWRTISPGMAQDYARQVEIANEGSRDLGFADTGALWRSAYDMSPAEFAAETERL
ncbi:MAG TPA: M2 family metallopeptidase, partial [Caulobacteraceae bacterium]